MSIRDHRDFTAAATLPFRHDPAPKNSFWFFLAQKLARVTSSGAFIPEIDGLRSIAILAVVILHATYQGLESRQPAHSLPVDWGNQSGSALIQLFSSGWIGVQIFFVISGFILALPFARQHLTAGPPVSIRRYFARRVTRIEPPYFICLTVAWLIIPSVDRMPLLPHYLAGLGYLHQIVFHRVNPVLTVAWSLEVEVFFYLLAPWLCIVFAVRQPLVRRGALMAFLLVYSFWASRWVIPQRGVMDDTLFAALQFFLAGMLLADLYVCGVFPRTRHLVWDVAAITGAAGLVYSVAWDGWSIYWLAPLFIMLMVLGAFQGSIFNRLMRLKPVTIVGGMCYSIYLWHTIGMWFTQDYLQQHVPRYWPVTGVVLLAVAFNVALALVLGALMFFLIEKPFMNGPGSRFLEKLFRRGRRVGITGEGSLAVQLAGSRSGRDSV